MKPRTNASAPRLERSFAHSLILALAAWALPLVFSCGPAGEEQKAGRAGQDGCAALGGSPWVPAVPGLGVVERPDPGSALERTVITASGPLTGIGEAPREISLEVPMPEDLGPGGSLTLVAESQGLPAGLQGDFYPVMVSLNDGKSELVNLVNAGNAGGVVEGSCGPGLFCCRGERCSVNPAWEIRYPSAFASFDHWQDRQVSPFGPVSSNTFPTCAWKEGCVFTDPAVFESPGLRFGKSWVARYALLLSDYERNPIADARAGFRVTVARKKKGLAASGAIDLNFVLVGDANVRASRTGRGKANLNALVAHILRHYAQPGSRVSIRRVRVIEWGCETGGDAFADIDTDGIAQLFARGSTLVPTEDEGSALNLFMVSNVRGGMSGFTVLGIAGAIGGPPVNGTAASGLAFSSFGKLASLNPECGAEDCPIDRQEEQFVEMGITLSHEIGHFLGLNHLSEMNGKAHDPVPDTPICMETELTSSGRLLTRRSCLRDSNPHPLSGRSCAEACPSHDGRNPFCPEAVECQFNHLMWYTGKNAGDGNFLSVDSGAALRFSPFVR